MKNQIVCRLHKTGVLLAFALALSAPPAGARSVRLTTSQLDHLVSRIALHPDPLLARILAASTYWPAPEHCGYFLRRHLQQGGLKDAVQASGRSPFAIYAISLVNPLRLTADLQGPPELRRFHWNEGENELQQIAQATVRTTAILQESYTPDGAVALTAIVCILEYRR